MTIRDLRRWRVAARAARCARELARRVGLGLFSFSRGPTKKKTKRRDGGLDLALSFCADYALPASTAHVLHVENLLLGDSKCDAAMRREIATSSTSPS